jgi:hypothetical protein
MRRVPGVTGARANLLTSNILLHYDDRVMGQESVLFALDAVRREAPGARAALPPAVRKRLGGTLPHLVPTPNLAGRTAGGISLPSARPSTAKGSVAVIKCMAAVAGEERFPLLREQLRGLLGRNAADLLFLAAGVLGNVLSASPFGLAAAGAEALLFLLMVLGRRPVPAQQEPRKDSKSGLVA